jgi:hypothetical protein
MRASALVPVKWHRGVRTHWARPEGSCVRCATTNASGADRG